MGLVSLWFGFWCFGFFFLLSFFLSSKPGREGFVQDALCAAPGSLRRIKLQLFNVTFDVFQAAPSHRPRTGQKRGKIMITIQDIRTRYLIARQRIQRAMRSSFGRVPPSPTKKLPKCNRLSNVNYWAATSAAKVKQK